MWELVKAGGWLMLPLVLCSIFTVAITKAEVGYKVLGANRDLAGVELAIAEQEGREFILRDASKQEKSKTEMAPDLQQLTQRLTDRFSANVKIDHNKQGKGKLTIHYHSLDELDGILNICLAE
jgi:ParB-like chromosome segregation protein Spo0J